ncbi:reverse transcriptase family protein [Arthrobacter sp. CJ23]|uniref:reverse transcriptase family protein n=1 Tax=Arthrobacter sp. CJ23 TaxID=2972479 RepID=UPI00215D1A34|nr:reverse transcriptase family protein [Arthrobacter sp. CJ23]UVJ39697.1 reverse transcriptase family protein [Arthrobacter sp. CJ23]
MTTLSRVRNLADLAIAASLPASAGEWLGRRLQPDDLRITTIRKPRGGYRVVCEPIDSSLMRLQKRLKEFIDRKVLDPHPSVHGFTRGRGPYSNAQAHLDARAILTVDVTDFFPSITRSQIEDALQERGASSSIAASIANVTTFRGTLATGFPTSPVLSNLVFRPLDDQFKSFADAHALTYTRYADDLTFSGDEVGDETLANVNDLLTTAGFQVNEKKVRFQRKGHPQIVTGFAIAHSDDVRLPKAWKRRLRQDLYYAARHGLDAQARHRNLDEDAFIERLQGRINYLMCAERTLALHLREEFDAILAPYPAANTTPTTSPSAHPSSPQH